MNLNFDTTLRMLMLPCEAGYQSEYTSRAAQILSSLDFEEELDDWVRIEADLWCNTGEPSKEFRYFISQMLYSEYLIPRSIVFRVSSENDDAFRDYVVKKFSEQYFNIHKKIMVDEKINHDDAKRILSNAYLIFSLALTCNMTASRIFAFLSEQKVNVGSSWSTIRLILDFSGMKQEMTVESVEKVFSADVTADEEILEDFEISDAIGYVAEICQKLGMHDLTEENLRTLFITDYHPPYLLILHYQLIISEVFNHLVKNAYEFKPRGDSVLWLTEKYNASNLGVGLSPFLNNAKSVANFDSGWASQKKLAERHGARALVEILDKLDQLSDPSRIAIGRYLRALLCRKLRLSAQKNHALPFMIPKMNSKEVQKILEKVAFENTGTRGLIEQRICEVLAMWLLDNPDNWSKKGLGDSVFTTNTARLKLGDIEFKNKRVTQVIAIEAHAGKLTQKYVNDHLYTASKIAAKRKAEFEERDSLNNWNLELQFVAHKYDPNIQKNVNLEGIQTKVFCRQYSDLIPTSLDDKMLDTFDELFTSRLNSNLVNVATRQKVIEMIQ